MFQEILNPLGNLGFTVVMAAIPVLLLLFLLAVLRMTAWLAVVISAIVTMLIAVGIWHTPIVVGSRAFLYGGLTGIWAIDWITYWGVVLYYTMVKIGLFDTLR